MTESKPCQYIKGLILDDDHKCGEPCQNRSSYCPEHHKANHRERIMPGAETGEYKPFTL